MLAQVSVFRRVVHKWHVSFPNLHHLFPPTPRTVSATTSELFSGKHISLLVRLFTERSNMAFGLLRL